MSLINDALKRAKQAHDDQNPSPVRGAPLHTAPTPAPQSHSSLFVMLGAMIIMAVALAAVIYYFHSNGSKTAAATAVPKATAPPDASLSTPTSIAPMENPQPAPAATTVAASNPGAPTNATPETMHIQPVVKLQGVLYSTHPAAIINGRTMFVGDRFGDIRVLSLQPQSATILWNGQTNELLLER